MKKVVKGDAGIFYCNELIVDEEFTPAEYDAYWNWTKATGQ